MPEGATVTRRQSLQQVWKSTGRQPEALADQPPLPEELAYLWEWFLELRTSEALTFTEIHYWTQLTQKRIRGWEVDVLRSIDRIYWRVMNDRYSTSAHTGSSGRRGGR
ncbi:MAG: phage tail assembly chaperone [Endozoicomonas sp.]